MANSTQPFATGTLSGVAARFTDCEVRDHWFLEQDINAWTSVSYVAAAAVSVGWLVRMRLPLVFGLLSATLLLEGVGSMLYHGGHGRPAQLLHDVPIVGMLGFVAGWHTGRLAGHAERGAAVGTLGAITTATALWVLAPDAVRVVAAGLVPVILTAELLARRRAMAPVWTAPLIAVLVIAGATWLAGTPDSPLCDPQSWLQPHGLWHILSAIVIVLWSARAGANDAVRLTSPG